MASIKSTKNKIVSNIGPGIGLAIGAAIFAAAMPYIVGQFRKFTTR